MQYFNKLIFFIICIFICFVDINAYCVCLNKTHLFNRHNVIVNQDKSVNFLNWVNYISPYCINYCKKFFDIDINFEYITSDSMTHTKIITGNNDTTDIVLQSLLYLPDEINHDYFLPLDKSKLPNWQYHNQNIYEKVSLNGDCKNVYGIVYTYGITVIIYNTILISKILGSSVVLDSWQYLYNPYFLKKLCKYGVAFLDDPEQIFGNYFQYIGIDPNTASEKDYEEAALYLIKYVRPYIKYFNSNRYQYDIIAENLCVAMGYSGDVIRTIEYAKDLNNNNVVLKYSVPKEGTNIWFDMLMIPRHSKHQSASYQILNIIIDPYISAQNSNYLYQNSGVDYCYNKSYLKQYLHDLNDNLNPQIIDSMYVLKRHSASLQDFIHEMWLYVKHGILFIPKHYNSVS